MFAVLHASLACANPTLITTASPIADDFADIVTAASRLMDTHDEEANATENQVPREVLLSAGRTPGDTNAGTTTGGQMPVDVNANALTVSEQGDPNTTSTPGHEDHVLTDVATSVENNEGAGQLRPVVLPGGAISVPATADGGLRSEEDSGEEFFATALHACARVKRLSAAANAAQDRLARTFRCELCYRTLCRPYTLECGNSYCEGCLFHYLDNTLTVHRISHPDFDALLDVALHLVDIRQRTPDGEQKALVDWILGFVLNRMPHPTYTCPRPSCNVTLTRAPALDPDLWKTLEHVVNAGAGIPPPLPMHPGLSHGNWTRFLFHLRGPFDDIVIV